MIEFPHICAYVPARNEEKFLPKTLNALLKIDIPKIDVLLVNDGSTDRTAQVSREVGIEVISLPNLGYSKLGRPELAETHNVGLKWAEAKKPDAVLIVGADHIIPPDYIKQLEARMNSNTALASGIARGEHLVPENPSGSGRLATSRFLDQVGWRYPQIYGWEAYWVYKAWQMGYETRCYKDIIMESQRPNLPQRRILDDQRAKNYGYAMMQLGYYWPNAVNRARIFGKKRPSACINMLCGYFTRELPRSDVAPYVHEMQFMRLLNATKRRIRSLIS